MIKRLVAGVILSLGLVACVLTNADDRIFIKETYVARLADNGMLTIDSNGHKAMELPLLTFTDKREGKHIRIWPPHSGFLPEIKIDHNDKTTEININCSKPGLVKSFSKKVTLGQDTILVETEAVPTRVFYNCGAGLKLFPKVFDGAEYSAINRNKPVSGKLPEGIPVKAEFTFNGLDHLSNITFKKTEIGIVSFNFGKSPRGLSDQRALKWSQKYNFHYFKINFPSDKIFKYTISIKISGKGKTAKKTVNTALKPAKVLFDLNFDNGFTAKANGNGKVQNKNIPELVNGISGKAAKFSNGKVLEYLEAGNLNKDKGTLAFWCKASNIVDPVYETAHDRTIFAENGRAKPGSNIMTLWKRTWGGLRFDLRNKGNSFWGCYDIYNWNEDEWHHVTLTWNNKKGIAIYVNGRLKQTVDVDKIQRGFLPLEWLPVPAVFFFIGAKDKQGNSPWLGELDEVKIFDRNLTTTEVQKEYERFAVGKLGVYTNEQYLFAGKQQNCQVILDNNMDKPVAIFPKCTVVAPNGKVIFSKKFPKKTINAHSKHLIDLNLNLFAPGDYILKVSYGKNERCLALKALPQHENMKVGGKLQLELIKTIDASKPPASEEFASKGDNVIVNSPIGKYRETGAKFHDRFVFGFELPEIDVPYLAVVTWPDNARRSMEILFLSKQFKESYQAPGGIFSGDAFKPSGKMKEYKVVFWPRTKKSAFMFMCLENGYPAAVKDIKIYQIKSKLPKMAVNSFKGSVPARNIGIFYEDPVIPMCFGAGSLFPGFAESIDRLLDYMQWFGQDILTYPIVWYHGPLYGSKVEPIIANRATRMHPDNFPAYLLKRLQARGMKFNGTLNINCLESLADIAITDEQKVFNGEETVINMLGDNHLQLTTSWNNAEPGYNILDPRVQRAVKNIIQEIIDRYGSSSAFTGLTLFAKHRGIFILGSLKSGYNDINLTRFQKDTGIKIPCYNPKDTYRFTKSYQWLMDNAKKAWMSWRSKMLHKFYKEIADMLTAKRKDLRLSIFYPDFYGKHLISTSGKYRDVGFNEDDNMKLLGIDIAMFRHDDNIKLCTLDRVSAMQHWRREHGPIIGIESPRAFGLIPEIAQEYKNLPQVSTILLDAYFEDTIGRVDPMKDLKKVLPHTTERGWRVSAINPNTFYCLENYAAALNNVDAVSITKGGFSVGTLGVEDWIGYFARAYRTLPAVKFDNIEGLADPVRVRQKVLDGRNYFYVLNRLPVEVKTSLKLSKSAIVKDLVDGREAKSLEMTLSPYGLRTFSVPADIKVVSNTTITPKSFVADLKTQLKKAENIFSRLEKTGVPVVNYRKFLEMAQLCAKEKHYARLYILLYESWVNDMKRLLANANLLAFLKVDKDYIKKQNRMRHAVVPTVKGTIKIDGILDEAAWKKAVVINDFADFTELKGKRLAKPASFKTEVRLLYNDKNIYLGITCKESNTKRIIIKKGLKDGPLWENDDSLEFFLKGADMKKGKFAQLIVNAGGSKTDIFGGGAGRSWNIDWQAQSRIIPDKSWVCEIAVPLKEICKKTNNKLLFNIGRHRGSNLVSGLSLVDGMGGWFCEQFWTKLDLK